MAKAKVTDLKGIVTNHDENDLSLETLSSSTNFKFENAWADIATPNVELDTKTPALNSGYSWERGIACILTSDILSDSDTSFQKEALFLVAKKEVFNAAGDISVKYRKFYVKIDDVWIDILATTPLITEEMISTEKEGEPFFANEQGRLKIYLPHISFWLGYIDRNIYTPGLLNWTTEGQGGPILYFDKLLEKFSFDNRNTDLITYSETLKEAILKGDYRLGASMVYEEYASADAVVGENITFMKILPTPGDFYDAYLEDFSLYKVKNAETGEFYAWPGEILIDDAVTTEDPSLVWWFDNGSSSELNSTAKIFGTYIKADNAAITYEDANSPYEQTINPTFLESIYASSWSYIAPLNVSIDDQGFSTSQYEIITTMTLDKESEIIVDYYKKEGIIIPEYGIKVTPYIARAGNKRMTNIAHYIRFDNVSDFELFYEFSLLDPKRLPVSSYATEGTLTGIYLASRIGIAIDVSKKDYDLVQGIKARTLESGYAIAIAYDNPAFIQYNAIGGGKIMNDIFYYEAELSLEDTLNTKALTGANGKIFIISDSGTKVLNIESSNGQPIFMMIDTLEFGVKSREDALEVQGGIILSTEEGIFMTNGYDKEWVSEQINNICILNYSTSRVFYNKYKHELYYFPNVAEGFYYLYSFRRKKWEGRTVKDLVNIKDLLQLTSGQISFLAEFQYEYTWEEDIEPPVVGPTLIDPEDIATLSAWYKGGEELVRTTAPVGSINTWGDTESGSFQLLTAAGTGLVTASINGITVPTIGTGVTDKFYNTGLPGESPFGLRTALTSVIVFYANGASTGSTRYIISDYSRTGIYDRIGVFLSIDATNTLRWEFRDSLVGNNRITANSTQSPVYQEPQIAIVTYNEATKTVELYFNGTKDTGTNAAYTLVGGIPSNEVNVGTYYQETVLPSSNINLLDVTTFDEVLDTDTINGLGSWYADRWGTTWSEI